MSERLTGADEEGLAARRGGHRLRAGPALGAHRLDVRGRAGRDFADGRGGGGHVLVVGQVLLAVGRAAAVDRGGLAEGRALEAVDVAGAVGAVAGDVVA